MRMYPSIPKFKAIALLLVFVASAGCAQQRASIRDTKPINTQTSPELSAVNVSSDASQVTIIANKPVTYTSYKTSTPPKAVIDLSQVEPGSVQKSLDIASGVIKHIEVVKHSYAGGFLTRIEIQLQKDVDFTVSTDPADKARLVVAFAKSTADETQQAPAAANVAKSEQTDVVKSAAAPKAPEVTATTPPPADPQPAQPEQASASASNEQSGTKPDVHPAETATPDASKDAVTDSKQPEPSAKPEETPTSDAKDVSTGADKALTAIAVEAGGVNLSIGGGGTDNYKVFTLSKPGRLVIDLFGLKSRIVTRAVAIDKFGITKARIGLTPEKVRVVFDSLKDHVPSYDVERTDGGLRVAFGEAGVSGSASVKEAKADSTPHVTADDPKDAAEVSKLDFKMENGLSRVIIVVGDRCKVGTPVKGARGVTLTIRNCRIPRSLQRTLDTSAFASSVLSVTPYQARVKKVHVARFVVRLRSQAPYEVKQEGNTVYWDFKNVGMPVEKPGVATVAKAQSTGEVTAPEEQPQPQVANATPVIVKPVEFDHKIYTGRRISLEFSDADIRKIFQLIAEVSNLNFLISDDVSGTISLKLVNVPWDQALDVILESKNLEMKREGNIVQIKPKGKFKTYEQEQADEKKAREQRMPLETKIFDVNYASIDDVATQFDKVKSDRGTVSKDSRTNRVIVNDIAPSIEKMQFLLKNLDLPEKQVMIEARIVEATTTFTRDLGVQWGVHYQDGSASFLGLNAVDSGFGGIVTPPPSSGFPAQDSAGGAVGMSFGKLTNNIQLDLRLSAAATAGLIKIISTPKVVTLNNKMAKISQGQSIPYQTTSAEGTKTEFVEAALTLEVTPHITSDGSVSMKIKASNNSPGSGTPPPINKKEATTELLVKNGETTVIGGIYVDSDTESNSGVPFLQDIPLLGWLFKSNNKTKTKTELLIFITPKIVS